jgi:hypothetical protein
MIYTNNIGVIPCTVPFGNQQTFINPSLEGTKVIFDHGEGLNQISWRLRDNKGEVILGQKEHLTLELVIWF